MFFWTDLCWSIAENTTYFYKKLYMPRNAMAHKNKLIRLQTNLSNTFCYVFKVINANCAINALHHIMDNTTPD